MICANRMPIMDCDETYNYWEPLHFIMYGSGMQTWEYAPDFALRTYAYLLPLQFLARLVTPVAGVLAPILTTHPITHERVALFVSLRSVLAGAMAMAELFFLTALCEMVPFRDSLKRQTPVTPDVALATALIMLTSTGMTHAAGALLPSSSVLLLWLICAGAYIRQLYPLFCAVAVVATLCLGWPFGVVVFVPIGIDILRVHPKPLHLLVGVALWTAVVQATVMLIDYPQYGKWVSPTLNIFQYNAAGSGDELYGIEPTSYYVKNLALNFNLVAALGVAFLPVSFLLRVLGQPLTTPLVVTMGCMYAWLSIVVPRPHKEERFLFPIYPCLCLGATVVVERMWGLVSIFFLGGKHRRVWAIFVFVPVMLSVSRSLALSKYYTAPLDVYAALPISGEGGGLVCTCGEWYRFPSSFYLPSGYKLAFLPSSFTGQLPKQFEKAGSRAGTNFNGLNKQEMDRYAESVKECSFIVELETSDDPECLRDLSGWDKLFEAPYLNAAETSGLHRALYLPFLHKGKYIPYSLYGRKK